MKLTIAWGGASAGQRAGKQNEDADGWLGVCGRWRGEGVHEGGFECLDIVCCVLCRCAYNGRERVCAHSIASSLSYYTLYGIRTEPRLVHSSN